MNGDVWRHNESGRVGVEIGRAITLPLVTVLLTQEEAQRWETRVWPLRDIEPELSRYEGARGGRV